MATVLRLRDDSDVVRIIAALNDTIDAADGRASLPDANECRARAILAGKLADELDAAEERGLLRSQRRTLTP